MSGFDDGRRRAVHEDLRSRTGAGLQRAVGDRCEEQADRGCGSEQAAVGLFHLLPALDRIEERLGAYPQQAVADGDYTKREAVVGAAKRGVDYYGSWTDTSEEWAGHGIAAAYHPSAFEYDEHANEMICPEGAAFGVQDDSRARRRIKGVHVRG